MNLILKRFSQDVDLSNPEEVQYYLVFDSGNGGEVRLPVQKETTEALVKMLYTPKAKVAGPKEEEDVSEEAEEPDEAEEDPIEEDEYQKGFEEEPESEDFGGPDEDLEDLEPSNGVLAVSPGILRRAITARNHKLPDSEDEVPSL